jgi:hypothetical protein
MACVEKAVKFGLETEKAEPTGTSHGRGSLGAETMALCVICSAMRWATYVPFEGVRVTLKCRRNEGLSF